MEERPPGRAAVSAQLPSAQLALVLLIGLSLTLIVVRLAVGGRPGRSRIALPRILPWIRRSPLALVRHAPLVPFLVGLAFFAVALADPVTTLHRESVVSRSAGSLLLDASSSMMAPFKTTQLGRNTDGIAFSTSVAAAEYFLRLAMRGKYPTTSLRSSNSATRRMSSRRSRATTTTSCSASRSSAM